MPSKTLWICAGVGLVVLSLLLGGGVLVNRDQRAMLVGEVKKVRTGKLDEQRSVVVLDFRVTNPSRHPFQVKDLELEVTTGGKAVAGRFIIEGDAKNVFLGVPELGEKYNPSFASKERVATGATADRMTAFVVDLPLRELEDRTKMVMRIRDADGPMSELTEPR